MELPFTRDAFLAVFAAQNAVLWPAHPVLYALALVATVAILGAHPLAGRIAAAVLALFWAMTGLSYHLGPFAAINPAAPAFAALFLIEAAVFAVLALGRGLRFPALAGWRRAAALGLWGYAIVAYPLIGALTGHGGMAGPHLGAAPCPTVIFTLGVLIAAAGPARGLLAAIPLAWAALGTSAALLLGMPEDAGLALGGAALLADLLRRAQTRRKVR